MVLGVVASDGKNITPYLFKPGVGGVGAEVYYMFLRYRYTPSPLTLFKGIKKLAPGTMIVLKKKYKQHGVCFI